MLFRIWLEKKQEHFKQKEVLSARCGLAANIFGTLGIAFFAIPYAVNAVLNYGFAGEALPHT